MSFPIPEDEPVTTVTRTQAYCDCGGEFRPNGLVLYSSPLQYVHECTDCLDEINLYNNYPITEVSEVSEV